jgi:hypothetical protein
LAKPYGLLLECFDCTNVAESEFDDWYDSEQIPRRSRVNGVLTSERWINAESESSMPGLGGGAASISLVLHDLESVEVLQARDLPRVTGVDASPWSQRLVGQCRSICHFEAEQTLPGRLVSPAEARGLMMFAMNVSAEVDAEFNAWFDGEHIPHLAAVPGVLAARRFRMSPGGTHRYLVLYHLSEPGVQASAAWKKGGASPITERMKKEFLAPERNPLRLVLKRYQRAGG